MIRGADLPGNYFVSQAETQLQREYAENCKSILPAYFEKKQPVCYLHSYGCQGNVSDGERLKRLISEMGFSFSERFEDADFVLLNTCAVRENAHDHVFGNLGILTHHKQTHPRLLIGLCGCMAQQEEVAQKVKKSYPSVNLLFGTDAFYKLPQLVYRIITGEKRVFDISSCGGVIAEDISPLRDHPFKASVPVMYGCNNFCSYCIVPYVKGRERSRRHQDILSEIEGLLQNGYKQVLLLGQNVNSYGRGLDDPISFAELIRKINELPYDFRIRFMTSHPKDVSRELLDAMASCEKVCKHLHLPMQAGSNRILKEMNRKYTAESYLEIVEYARKIMPDISLTSDIIVGFPSEQYEDFLQTLSMVEKVRFDSLFTFIYSKRAYTKASKMEDPVPLEEKKAWLTQLIDLQHKIGLESRQKYLGTVQRVLIEEKREPEDYYIAKTDTNISVEMKGRPDLLGKFMDVKITDTSRITLRGEVIEERGKKDGTDSNGKRLGKAATGNQRV